MGRGRSELRAGPLDWVGSKLEVPVRQTAIAPGGVSLLDFQASRSIPSEGDAEGNRDKRTAREEALADGKRSPEDVDAAIAGASKVFYKALIADTDAAMAAAVALEKASDERFDVMRPHSPGCDRRSRTFVASRTDSRASSSTIPIRSSRTRSLVRTVPRAWPTAPPPEPVSAADAAARVATAAKFLRKQDPTNPPRT